MARRPEEEPERDPENLDGAAHNVRRRSPARPSHERMLAHPLRAAMQQQLQPRARHPACRAAA